MGPAIDCGNQLGEFYDTIVCTGYSNCNRAIGAIGLRAPPTVHNELESEIRPKSETWTRKLMQVEQLH
jgi:hypothetical protein